MNGHEYSIPKGDPRLYPEGVKYEFPKLQSVSGKLNIIDTNLKSLNFLNQIDNVNAINIMGNSQMTNCDFPNLDMSAVSVMKDIGITCLGK